MRALHVSRPMAVLGMILAISASIAIRAAEPVPPITFGASVTNADGSLTTALTWNAPGYTSCVGSGHPAWNGTKAITGTQNLPAITLSGSYPLTLACTKAGDADADLSWIAPTQNTDNTPLTNLAGYRVLYGPSATALNQTVELANPAQLNYKVINLTAGQWFFAVRAYSTTGQTSVNSNIASMTTEAGIAGEAAVSLTVNPVPRAITNLTAR